MPRYWFKPHRYGYGATPITWQAWAVSAAVLLVFVAAILGVAFWLKWSPWALPALLAVTCLLVGPFLWFCRRKTSGPWRWRWGEDA